MSVDGSSKKIVWTEVNKSAVLTFTSVVLSAFEEVSFQLYFRDTLYNELFTVAIGGSTFTFTKKVDR